MAAAQVLDRPAGAPQGAVRAHMATFPPRAGILRTAIHALLPQVDHLYLVLNGYEAVPDDLAAEPKITAVIPNRDLRDAGKFWFAPAPDDIVFLTDDDLAYPPDYVERSIRSASQIGWDGNAFGYMANCWGGADGWQFHRLRAGVAEAVAVRVVGTGTVVARGDMIPPLAAVENGHGYCDVMFAHWIAERGARLWMLPRPADWLASDLPDDLLASSLFVTAAPHMPQRVQSLLVGLVRRSMPHDGATLSALTSRAAAVAAAEE